MTMKKLLFLLLFLPVVGLSQDYQSFYVRQDTAQILNRAYASGTVDTCQALDGSKFKEIWLALQVTDTASIHVKALLSADGSTYTPVTASLDSVSVAAATGGIRVVNIKSHVGNAKFRLVFNQTAFRVPVAGTHLYTARITYLK
jgi:hypothetical protein